MSIESLLCLSSRMPSILIHIKSIESSKVENTVPPTFLGGSAVSTYQKLMLLYVVVHFFCFVPCVIFFR